MPNSFNSFRFIVSFNLHNNYSYFTEEVDTIIPILQKRKPRHRPCNFSRSKAKIKICKQAPKRYKAVFHRVSSTLRSPPLPNALGGNNLSPFLSRQGLIFFFRVHKLNCWFSCRFSQTFPLQRTRCYLNHSHFRVNETESDLRVDKARVGSRN